MTEAQAITNLRKLLNNEYGGDLQKMWDHYTLSSPLMDANILGNVFKDAGIGNNWTLPIWVRGAIARLDKDGDGKISMDELKAAMDNRQLCNVVMRYEP